MFGLKQKHIDLIIAVMQRFTAVEQASIFGSRAMGNYKKGSDVDIAIMGSNIDCNLTSKISYLLNEETSMPYFFDVIHYESITNGHLIEHIDRVGNIFYDQSLIRGLGGRGRGMLVRGQA